MKYISIKVDGKDFRYRMSPSMPNCWEAYDSNKKPIIRLQLPKGVSLNPSLATYYIREYLNGNRENLLAIPETFQEIVAQDIMRLSTNELNRIYTDLNRLYTDFIHY